MPELLYKFLVNQSPFTIKRRILTLAFALFLIPACIPKDNLVAYDPPKQGVPPGFIALSEREMSWTDSKAYCQQHGGKLPRVNNSDSLPMSTEPDYIEGFGKVRRDPWPVGMPFGYYWAGTAISNEDGWVSTVTSVPCG